MVFGRKHQFLADCWPEALVLHLHRDCLQHGSLLPPEWEIKSERVPKTEAAVFCHLISEETCHHFSYAIGPKDQLWYRVWGSTRECEYQEVGIVWDHPGSWLSKYLLQILSTIPSRWPVGSNHLKVPLSSQSLPIFEPSVPVCTGYSWGELHRYHLLQTSWRLPLPLSSVGASVSWSLVFLFLALLTFCGAHSFVVFWERIHGKPCISKMPLFYPYSGLKV